MSPRRATDLIFSEPDLWAALDLDGDEALDSLIYDQVEFCDWVDEVSDDSCFSRTIGGLGTTHFILLTYPFAVDDFEREIRRADRHLCLVAHCMEVADEDCTIASPADAPLDVTPELARWIFGGAEVSQLVKVLGGEWQVMDLDVQSASGDLIYAWFVPSDDRMVALGIGAVDLFVTRLHRKEDGGYFLEEDYAVPDIALWRDGEVGSDRVDPDVLLTELESAISSIVASTGGPEGAGEARLKRTPDALAKAASHGASQEHDVRMSTTNLRVAGIDLDFEVKRGGLVLGSLSVSQGGLLWRPARTHRKRGRARAGIPISWAEFAAWAET